MKTLRQLQKCAVTLYEMLSMKVTINRRWTSGRAPSKSAYKKCYLALSMFGLLPKQAEISLAMENL